MSSLIQAISEAEREIETAQNELSSVRSYLVHNRAIVTNWSSPLAMLPYELIQEIVDLIVTPHQRHDIMRLSRVSKRWQEAVLGMPWLFTTADWNTWSYPLIELWCQRAGTQSLNISLGDRAIRQLLPGERGSQLMCLLNSCASRWGELEIRLESVRLKREGVTEAVGRLLQGSTPLLRHLTLFTERRENKTMLSAMLDCPPLLNVSLSGVWVSFRACSTSVTDLTLHLSRSDQLSRIVDVLKNCPLIQRLKLDLEGYSEEDLIDFTRTKRRMLPSLVHLELHDITMDGARDIGQILCCFNIPNLNSLTLVRSTDSHLLPSLVSAVCVYFAVFPNLSSCRSKRSQMHRIFLSSTIAQVAGTIQAMTLSVLEWSQRFLRI